MISTWCFLLFLIVTAVAAELGGNLNVCGSGPRVRKAWGTLSRGEKRLFKDALAASMRSGEYYQFALIHMEEQSSYEAHQTCGFLLWHRSMLLAFENHLRDLDPKFQCLTLPFWNIAEDYADFVSDDQICSSMADCSPVLTDMCGHPENNNPFTYPVDTVRFNGHSARGFKYDNYPCNQACSDGRPNCDAFVVRNNMTREYPPSAGYANMFNMYSTPTNYRQMTFKILSGAHGRVHGAVGGLFGTMATPSDPLFYLWHGMIDFQLALFTECKVGNPFTPEQSRSSDLAFAQCTIRTHSNEGPSATSKIHMNLKAVGSRGPDVLAENHPTLGKYFRAAGLRYANYADTRSLGRFAYRYDVPAPFRRHVLEQDFCPGYNPRSSSPAPAPEQSDQIELAAVETQRDPSSPAIAPMTESVENEQDASAEEDKEAARSERVFSPTSRTSSSAFTSDRREEKDTNTREYWQWFKRVEDHLNELLPGNKKKIAKNLAVLECVEFYQKYGAVQVSSEILDKMMYKASDECLEAGEAAADGSLVPIVQSTGFDPKTVHTAPGVEPEPFFKEGASTSDASALSHMLSFILVFSAIYTLI